MTAISRRLAIVREFDLAAIELDSPALPLHSEGRCADDGVERLPHLSRHSGLADEDRVAFRASTCWMTMTSRAVLSSDATAYTVVQADE